MKESLVVVASGAILGSAACARPAPAAAPSASASASASASPSPSASLTAAPSPTPSPHPAPIAATAVRTVVIDPGHNGANSEHTSEINRLVDAVTLRKPCDTTGTATDAGYAESAFNFDVASRLATILRRSGIRVVLTRTTDTWWGPCITERAAIGNRNNADAAISIHADGGPVAGRGFHVIEPALIAGYTDRIVAPSQRLGVEVRDAYRSGTGIPYSTYLGHAGIDVRSDLGGLNLSKVPKVFVECGNLRNSTDASLLSTSGFRARIASALAQGLQAFLAAQH